MKKIIMLLLVCLSSHITVGAPADEDADAPLPGVKSLPATDTAKATINQAEKNYIRDECQKFAQEDNIGQQGIKSYLDLCIAELITAVEKALSSERILNENKPKNPLKK